MSFSDRAKPLKENGKVTLQDIADACHISTSTASRYINGSVVPPDDMADKIMGLLEESSGVPEGEGEEEMQEAISIIREGYLSVIDELHGQIEDLKQRVRKENREKWIFTVLFLLTVLFFFLMTYIDVTNGSVGWFRH